jgi:ATP-binding cassette subfamily C (CFTR/MRP) protein 1
MVVQRFYVISCSKLKRLDSVSRSPVFSHLGETLNGISTIKAYQVEPRFLDTIQKRIDYNNQFFYPINVLEWYPFMFKTFFDIPEMNFCMNNKIKSWLEVYLSLVGNLMILFAAVFAILARDTISPGLAGLSISFALNVSAMLNHLVTMSKQLESNMTSVERVKE